MNCPNCGSQITTGQQFCRSCGSQLSADASPLRGKWTFVGLILAFAGILIALSGRMLLHLEMVTLVGVLVSVSGMFLIASTPFILARKKERSVKDRACEQQVLVHADPTNKLLPIGNADYIPVSVTENTTILLKDPVRTHSAPRDSANLDRPPERP